MSSVLFDTPGPRARARWRLYNSLGAVLLLSVLALVLWRMSDTGQLAYALWEPFVTPDYIRFILVDGLLQTLKMAGTSVLLALVFGTLFGIGKLSDRSWVRWPCWLVVEFFRAVPLLLLIVFIYYAYGVGDGIGSYLSVVAGLTLYNGAVLAEVLRAGINAVPRGQAEAAYAIGMRKSQVMRTILLPQAVKIMLPAIISQCVVALKDTSLGYIILAPGLSSTARPIFQEFGNQVQAVIVITVIYIVVNLLLTLLATWVQKRYVGEKKPLEAGLIGPRSENPGGAL